MTPTLIVDVDDTLVDSNDAHARAWVEACAQHGVAVRFDAVRPLIGMGGDELMERATPVDPRSAQGERLAELRGAIFRERHLPGVRPFPGVRELLERAARDGAALVVATSASEEDLRALLGRAGVADLLRLRTGPDDVERAKPAPDVIGADLARARARPENALMLGDTPYDVAAARRAGVGALAVRSGGWSHRDLSGALAVYDDAAHLLAEYDASPLARLLERGRGA